MALTFSGQGYFTEALGFHPELCGCAPGHILMLGAAGLNGDTKRGGKVTITAQSHLRVSHETPWLEYDRWMMLVTWWAIFVTDL